jgi:hypothetical protein
MIITPAIIHFNLPLFFLRGVVPYTVYAVHPDTCRQAGLSGSWTFFFLLSEGLSKGVLRDLWSRLFGRPEVTDTKNNDLRFFYILY